MITITTISSTRVKPSSDGRRSGLDFGNDRSASDKIFELKNGKKDCEDDGRYDRAHDNDDRRLKHRQSGRGEIVELALEIVGRTREHDIQPSRTLATRREIDKQGREYPGTCHCARQAAATANGLDQALRRLAECAVLHRPDGQL